jgi:hypothetical protein
MPPRCASAGTSGRRNGRNRATSRQLDTGIWTIAGDPIRFLTFPYELRCTVVDLGGGSLFVHSPVQLVVAAEAVASIGRIEHIVTPNKLHHLFLGEWQAAFPEARLHAPPGLRAKRPDLSFCNDLQDGAPVAWEHGSTSGSYEEASSWRKWSSSIDPRARSYSATSSRITIHVPSVCCTGSSRARTGCWRRQEARRTVEELLSWRPRRVLVMHGPTVEHEATAFLRQAFRWLL